MEKPTTKPIYDSYNKDFSKWFEVKTTVNNQPPGNKFYYYEKEVWWLSVGLNVGFEEDGKGSDYIRPVLVLRKFNKSMFWGIPLSTTPNRGRYYYPFTISGNKIGSVAILSQLKNFDSNRLVKKEGVIGDKDYEEIQKRISEIVSQKSQR